MVVAWLAVDELEGNVALDIYKGTHATYSNKYKYWNSMEYCSEEKNIKSKIDHDGYDKERIILKPGDVALFQGLTFHNAVKTCGCNIDTCRRITLRYVDGEVTRWRDDIPSMKWPPIRMMAEPGELVNRKMPVVYDINNAVNYNMFDKDGPILPGMNEWFGYVWHVIQNGFQYSDMVFLCPQIQFL